MQEILLRLDDAALGRFRERLGAEVGIEAIATEAMTLYAWALEQRRAGRLVVSFAPGTPLVKPELPGLETAGAPATGKRH